MADNFDLEKTLIEFNQDQQFIELRERYSTRSFLEIMSVERSENRHSSFLAWLLEAKDFAVNVKDHPIVHLLDIAIRRLGEQGEKIEKENDAAETKCDAITGSNGIKNIVLSRDIKDINIEEITTEKAVKDVTSELYKDNIQDRIDIYIKCKLKTVNSLSSKEITIIIENKVGSNEGQEKNDNKPNADSSSGWKEYCKKKQTERYYMACHGHQTIFIFLTPGKDKRVIEAQDKHFINITYQDILDEIIEPLLANQNISSRIRVLLEEYVLSLSLPGIYTGNEDNNKKKSIKSAIIMAEKKQDVEKITELLYKHQNYVTLILSAAKCLSEENEIIGANYEAAAIKSAIFFTPQQDEEVKYIFNLLNSFGHTYKNLFIAILKTYINSDESINDTRIDEIKEVYKSLISNARDLSEFSVKKDGTEQLKSRKGKPGKGLFAEFIIRKYIECYNNQNLKENPYDYFKINENYPLFKSINGSEPKDPTRYSKDPINFDSEQYYISNQWGITINKENRANSKEEKYLVSIDKIFFKIFGKALIDLEDGKTYSTNSDEKSKLTLQEPWDRILKDYTITVKRIYK